MIKSDCSFKWEKVNAFIFSKIRSNSLTSNQPVNMGQVAPFASCGIMYTEHGPQ